MSESSTVHRVEVRDSRSLSGVPDESVELIVTSPPYPMIEMWDDLFRALDPAIGGLADAPASAHERMHAQLDLVWGECHRLLRNGGILCINIGDATRTVAGRFQLYSNHSRIISCCRTLGFESMPLILWRKQTNAPNKFMGSGMYPPGAYVTLEHEYILLFRKGGKREFLGVEERRRRRESAYFWEERNIWFSDVWDFKGSRQVVSTAAGRNRSGAFPLELAFRLVSMFSIRGDTVLDPFLGTGTTLFAAALAGRNSLGFEMDRGLAAEATDRLRDSIVPLQSYQLSRVDRHLEFAEQRRLEGRPCRYLNTPHGFPVVTRQETELKIDLIQGIEPWPAGGKKLGSDGSTAASVAYRSYSASDLRRSPQELQTGQGELEGLFDADASSESDGVTG